MLEIVLKQLGLAFNNELTKALTHNSFETANNNSRYVFCGMYIF
jgi:hypothetical protein